jgi:MFS family permease
MDNLTASRPVFTRMSQFAWLASFWLGINFLWATLLPVVIPARLEAIVPTAELGARQGMLLGLGALVSALLQLTIGFISDSTESRFGRRKPFLAFGVATSIGALLYFMASGNYWQMLLAYFFVQITINIASVPFQSMMPDLVPERYHGRAASMMGIFDLTGKLTGLLTCALIIAHVGGQPSGKPNFTVLTILYCVLLTGLASTVLIKAPSYPAIPSAGWLRFRFGKGGPLQVIREFCRFEFGKCPDFLRLMIVRTCILFGFYTLLFWIYRFAKTNLGVGDHREQAIYLLAAIIIGAVPGNIIGGRLCDYIGKRRVIYIGMAVTVALLIPIIFAHSIEEAYLMGFFLGLGWGSYIAGDWAFAFTLIPKDRTARYMGLWDMTALLSQTVAPAISGFARDALIKVMPGEGMAPEAEAFRIIFSFAILYFIAGLIVLSFVREPQKKAETATGE